MKNERLLKSLAILISLSTIQSASLASDSGYVYVLGKDKNVNSQLWRFDLDGTYLGNIAPDNPFESIVAPGDGYLYGIHYSTSKLTRMNLDGSNPQPVNATINPSDAMGNHALRAHADGTGGILMTPARHGTPIRCSTDGEILATYQEMQHTGGIAGDFNEGKVFSPSSNTWSDDLYEFSWSGGARTKIADDIGISYDMAIDRENQVLFFGYEEDDVRMYDYDGQYLGDLNVGQSSFLLEYDNLTGSLFSVSFPFASARAVDMYGNVVTTYDAPGAWTATGFALHTIPEPCTAILFLAGTLFAMNRRR